MCLEFSRPVFGWLRALYDWYSFRLLPWIGTKVARDTTGVYEYLPASIRTFPGPGTVVPDAARGRASVRCPIGT